MTNSEKARYFIQSNIYMTLATAGNDSTPWAAPLFYAYDDSYRLYFVSAPDSTHAQHISVNKKVAVAIYDSTSPLGHADGVQLEAEAGEVPFQRIPRIALLYYKRRFADQDWKAFAASLLSPQGPTTLKMYYVHPTRVYTLNEAKTKRIEVDLFEKLMNSVAKSTTGKRD